MRVQGKIHVQGATLALDVDIPEGGGVVAVTNAPAECLIIPRERLPLAAFGLSEGVRQELVGRSVVTIADLIGPRGWSLCPIDVSEKAAGELNELVSLLFAATLMPDDPDVREQEDPPTIPFPIDGGEELGEARSEPSLKTHKNAATPVVAPEETRPLTDEDPLIVLKLPDRAARALQARSCSTISALCSLTKAQLVMTSGLTSANVTFIETALARSGRQLRSRKGN